MSSSVNVGVRIRPLLSKERHQGISFNTYDSTSVDFKGQTFTFDHVFGMELSQQDLYNETAAPMLKSFLEGYNVTVIAYGQTGSGKTFSMGTSDIEEGMEDSQGLIPRFVADLFENLKTGVEGGRLIDSKVMISFLEIYGEDVFDLNGHGERISLPIREDLTGGRGIFVEGLQNVQVSSAILALDLLCNGTKNRVTGSTQMNSGSSRSHAVYTISLEQTLQSSSSDDDIHQMHSKLTFVDLAGSERLKRTCAEGQRLKEGIQINSGLFNLGQVINCLADDQKLKHGGKSNHIPYRNSKLTHLLKDALGGNSQTLFLACVSPAESNESETLSTLNYARQARNIENKPVVNMDKAQQELRHLKYAVKTWMMKAISQKFSVRLSSAEFRNNAAALGNMTSPLPCLSPLPTSRIIPSSASKVGDFSNELIAIMQRPEVQEYMNAVNKAINEKLLVGCAPSPRKVRLSLAGELASPYRTPSSKRALQGVAKKLLMPPKVAWDEVPVGGVVSVGRRVMPAIREYAEDGEDFTTENPFRSAGARGRGRGRESVLFAAALDKRDDDPDETERLVTRMLQMVSMEKQLASENLSGESEEMDLKNMDDVTDDADRELQLEEENHHEQVKKMGEVDNVIAEKEEILIKLLDTVRGYSAMKSDFERLVDAIGTLESERLNLENELDKAKRTAESQSNSHQSPTSASNAAVERIKERFLKVKEELRVMREERTRKENAYRLMQRESKQVDTIQKELLKLKESKVAMQRQQRVQGQLMAKMKKEQQVKLTSMKKFDAKKQKQMTALKSELVKRERILGHKDREILRINSKLKACEEHIGQLLKIQNRNRSGRTGVTGTTSSPPSTSEKGILTPAELEHLQSSKAMLDNLLADRVEKWKNKVLFQRKSNSLKDLNRELEGGAKELEILLKKKKELYDASNKDEDEDDQDAEDSIENPSGETSEEGEKRKARLAVRLQVQEAESFIDAITRDLDLLNTDVEDLALHLDSNEMNNDSTPSGKNKNASKGNWEDIEREIIANFSLPQCQSLLWDQIGEKAALLEAVRAGQFEQQEAKDEARKASTLADNMSRQLANAKADMQSRLQQAESQRVRDVWALIRAQQDAGDGSVSPNRLSDGDLSIASCVAIQRAQDLEMELEGYIASDDKLNQQAEEQAARISSLEASLLNIQLRTQMTESNGAGISGPGSEFFDSLSSVWNSLGVTFDDRSKAVSDIQRAGIRARETAFNKARKTLNNSNQHMERLQNSLTQISAALGQKEETFFSNLPGLPTEMPVHDRLLSMSVLPRLSAIRDAVDAATAVMTVRASGLEKLKERLLDIMSEMWLDSSELPDCLKNVIGIDFHAAAIAANKYIEEASDDSDDGVDEIAAFMVTSALCVANQLDANNVVLTEGNITNWEKAMQTLNVMRGKLTTQMIAVRAETSILCNSLNLDSDALLNIIRGGSDILPTQAQEAVVELVLGSGVSNPPGSQILLTAVGELKSELEIVKVDRVTIATLTAKINTQLNNILGGDEIKDEEIVVKINTNSMREAFLLASSIDIRAGAVKTQLLLQLKGLLKYTAGSTDEDSQDELISLLLSPRAVLSTPPTPQSMTLLDAYIKDMQTISGNTKDLWINNEISTVLSNWGDINGGVRQEGTDRNTIAQICILRVEVRRLLRLSETFNDLQRLDGQLVKHIGEMEEFEAASKVDRIKLLSGNSKALIEEEKFRKSGKRKYEQITERMIALSAILERLAMADGASSPTSAGGGGPTVGPIAVDFSCISSQGQALLRGKCHWQERVELMHLHTTTHGTRRWSGGGDKDPDDEISPKGTQTNVFSTAPAATTHKSRIQAPTPNVSPLNSTTATVSANPFAAAAANPFPVSAPSATPSVPSLPLGSAIRPTGAVPVLSQLNLGLGALASRGGASKATGSASVTSSSLSPRNKASAQTMKESLAVMTTSLASLSGSQRMLPYTTMGKGEKCVSFLKIGDENQKNVNK